MRKGSTKKRRGGKRAVAIAVQKTQKATVKDIAEFTGTLLPRTQFVVAPKVSGRLDKLFVNIGDKVKNDQLVAVLDGEEYGQQVAQANAEVDVSKANLAEYESALSVASKELDRIKRLRQQKVSSEAELDTAKARWQSAKSKHTVANALIKQKEAALETAKIRESYTQIKVSWEENDSTRVVAERFVDEGAMLKASEPIVSIVDVNTVIAIVNVIERDFPRIKMGQEAKIATDAYPDKIFTGRVARRAPILKEATRQARVEIEIDNSDGLLAPGMFVRVEMLFAQHDGALTVPTDALVTRKNVKGVFLVDREEMKAKFVPLEVGIIDGPLTEVISPQISGDVVVLGHHLLEDGISVVLADEQDKKEEKGKKGKEGKKGKKRGGGQK